ncbi:hippurate hydrolase [Allocatelliglobosispora scoriae]|uniref:Hippurate hydrolase n=1 Tax=Allocatelliglobosispora scoriae TaxID=643052 RepID=A0A841BNA9_9ACTN|nr:amidohydrolase [Allocatelliglobosispora scoriae]MBB5868443.1 hippurate hydrolase [Allocatelliglobosispora scoriae]
MIPADRLDTLHELYRDLHEHPELSFAETRTAAIAARELHRIGFEVTEGVGRTGVVGVLRNGAGPTVLLRADFDALPVAERTGLPYASRARGIDPDGNDIPVMHACGHDVHLTCLLGALEVLASDRDTWRGTILAVCQPAEELGAGAQAMIDDGLFERFGRPDIVLGQHVAPAPAGMLGIHPGPAFAATDSLRVVLHRRGGHGSRPETTVDPVVMAAYAVTRLQTVVSREVAGGETAVVTVGSLVSGTKDNIIPDDAVLQINVRTYTPAVRDRVLTGIRRILEAAFADHFGAGRILSPGPVTGSEDCGLFATAAGVPCCYWLFGGLDPALFADGIEAGMARAPANHSPLFAPVVEPTISVGVEAMVIAAHTWLADFR